MVSYFILFYLFHFILFYFVLFYFIFFILFYYLLFILKPAVYRNFPILNLSSNHYLIIILLSLSDEMMGTISHCKTAAANMFYILNQSSGSSLYSHSYQSKDTNIHDNHRNLFDIEVKKKLLNYGSKEGEILVSEADYMNRNNIVEEIQNGKKTKEVQEEVQTEAAVKKNGKEMGKDEGKEKEEEKGKEKGEKEGEDKRNVIGNGNHRNTIISGTSSPQTAVGIGSGDESVDLYAESSYLEMMRSMSETINIGNVHLSRTFQIWKITEMNIEFNIKINESETDS